MEVITKLVLLIMVVSAEVVQLVSMVVLLAAAAVGSVAILVTQPTHRNRMIQTLWAE
jgi:hypothetical protein